MKHLVLDYHFVSQHVQSGLFKVSYILTYDQLADGLTKSLTRQISTLAIQDWCS